jgi:hypothetical protein
MPQIFSEEADGKKEIHHLELEILVYDNARV